MYLSVLEHISCPQKCVVSCLEKGFLFTGRNEMSKQGFRNMPTNGPTTHWWYCFVSIQLTEHRSMPAGSRTMRGRGKESRLCGEGSAGGKPQGCPSRRACPQSLDFHVRLHLTTTLAAAWLILCSLANQMNSEALCTDSTRLDVASPASPHLPPLRSGHRQG
ncbi:unnamed protein product [Durusdinium trenchii]|uniref:Uncharacterized protein n=1 Tax=Durusdinium trenchii TaxID=1381693 RepID=A0ABP0S1Q6_9DINO